MPSLRFQHKTCFPRMHRLHAHLGSHPGNNHPFTHNLSIACFQCRTKRNALFLSWFLCVGWVVLHRFSCAVRGTIGDLISTDGSVWIYHMFFCVLLSAFGVRTFYPTPKEGETESMTWMCRKQRKERGWGGGDVRTCTGVGGRGNKIIWAKGYQNVYMFNFLCTPNVQSQVKKTWHVFLTDRVISLSIVTAHNFFVLHDNDLLIFRGAKTRVDRRIFPQLFSVSEIDLVSGEVVRLKSTWWLPLRFRFPEAVKTPAAWLNGSQIKPWKARKNAEFSAVAVVNTVRHGISLLDTSYQTYCPWWSQTQGYWFLSKNCTLERHGSQ